MGKQIEIGTTVSQEHMTEEQLYDEAFKQMSEAPLEHGENLGPGRGGARPAVRPDDGRRNNRGVVGKSGPPRKGGTSTVPISAEHQQMLDGIVAQRRAVQPDTTRRQVVERMIAEQYAALDEMWREAAEIAGE